MSADASGSHSAATSPAVDWTQLLSTKRFRKADAKRKKTFEKLFASPDFRTEHEKDFDRVVFSSPVRRLQDKTQVFPLDQHDSVRTRLTHSLEVANIGRTLAAQLAHDLGITLVGSDAMRAVPALVAAISIAHDIGNPPFGHQGEAAIRGWVKIVANKYEGAVSSKKDKALLADYLNFDGNPQGFRLLTMFGIEDGGLNLTASTLRASFKYPWSADSIRAKEHKKKFGFFQTEKHLFDWAGKETGIAEGVRHPLASIMEASDDICYSILDVEDGVKKRLVSTAHLMLYLRNRAKGAPCAKWVAQLVRQYNYDVKWLSSQKVDGHHAEDVLMQLLRTYFISLVVSVAVPELKTAISADNAGAGNPCLSHGECASLLELLKDYTKAYIYSHPSVEKVELEGHSVIPYLLGAFWSALESNEQGSASMQDKFVIKKISPNYLRVYDVTLGKFPSWYARLQVCCDMVCGMTDSFAISAAQELKELGVPRWS
jgi:dGTPase